MASWQIFISLVPLLFCLIVPSMSDQQFTCPNRGKPKLNKHTGRPMSCLPGDASEKICGKGYSCFFSGIDYRCCPSTDDGEVEDHSRHSSKVHECPSGSLAVLNANGAPIKCNAHSRQCPKPESQFCVQHSLSASICCEQVSGIEKQNPIPKSHGGSPKASAAHTYVGTGPPPPRVSAKSFDGDVTEGIKAAAKVLTQKELNKITVVVNRDIVKLLACPANSLNVVSTKGLPIKCSASKKCPNANMFCYRARLESICCQEFQPNAGAGAQGNVQNGINQVEGGITPSDANKLVEELKAQAAAIAQPSVVGAAVHSKVTSSPADNDKPRNKGKKDGAVSSEKDAAKEEGHIRVQVNRSKAHAVKTKAEERIVKTTEGANQEIIEYKPHNQGGYSVSRNNKPEKTNSRGPDDADRKLMAQQFLIDQIKGGWPYDEKFYRAANTANVHHLSGNPAVIVHFSTE